MFRPPPLYITHKNNVRPLTRAPAKRGYEDALGGPDVAAASSGAAGKVDIKQEAKTAEDEMASKIQWLIANVENQTHRYLDMVTNAKIIMTKCETKAEHDQRYLTPLMDDLKQLLSKAQKLANLLTKMQTTVVNTSEMPKVVRLKEEIDTLKLSVDSVATTWGMDGSTSAASGVGGNGGGKGGG